MSEKSELLNEINATIDCLNIISIKIKELKYKDANNLIYNDNERFLFLQGYEKAINDLTIALCEKVVLEQIQLIRLKDKKL